MTNEPADPREAQNDGDPIREAASLPAGASPEPRATQERDRGDDGAWRSMDTAPKDGTSIWGGHWKRGMHANDEAFAEITWWSSVEQEWQSNLGPGAPDYWLPLVEPPPPKRDGSFCRALTPSPCVAPVDPDAVTDLMIAAGVAEWMTLGEFSDRNVVSALREPCRAIIRAALAASGDRLVGAREARYRDGMLRAAEIAAEHTLDRPEGPEWGLMEEHKRSAFYSTQCSTEAAGRSVAAAIRAEADALRETPAKPWQYRRKLWVGDGSGASFWNGWSDWTDAPPDPAGTLRAFLDKEPGFETRDIPEELT